MHLLNVKEFFKLVFSLCVELYSHAFPCSIAFRALPILGPSGCSYKYHVASFGQISNYAFHCSNEKRTDHPHWNVHLETYTYITQGILVCLPGQKNDLIYFKLWSFNKSLPNGPDSLTGKEWKQVYLFPTGDAFSESMITLLLLT